MSHTHIGTLSEAIQKIPSDKIIVVAGGCFDILHPGHQAFLKASKKQGEVLVVLLESDTKIKEVKGLNRPRNTQTIRAQNLAKLDIIDFIILLPYLTDNQDYDKMISSLKPAIITTTTGDPYRFHKERQAKLVNGKVVDVIERLPEFSTTNLLNHE